MHLHHKSVKARVNYPKLLSNKFNLLLNKLKTIGL